MKAFWKNLKHKTLIFTILGIILFFLIWFIIYFSINSTLFPGPIETFKQFGLMMIDVSTYEAIGGTLLRLLISMLICTTVSMLLGLLAGLYEWIYRLLNPIIIVLRTLPVAAVIFILIVTLKPRYALFIITALTMFPLLYEAIATGIRNIEKGIMDSARLDSHLLNPRTVVNIIIPNAKENIILGIVQALGLGMKVSLMAEVLVGTDTVKGIGRMLYRGYRDLDMPVVFASALIAIILIGLVDIALHFIKKKFATK